MSNFKSQGYFGKDTSRQTAQLERAARDGIERAAKAFRLKTGRTVEEETVITKADTFYQVDCVSNEKGAMFMLPDPKLTPGASIRISALAPTVAPYTTFTLVPSAGYTVAGDSEAITYQDNNIKIELTAIATDWALSSKTP